MERLHTHDVEITPGCVEFFDAEADVLHQMIITVKNLNRSSQHVKFISPQSKFFHLRCKIAEKTIASGLELHGVVEYYNEDETDCHEVLQLRIDGKPVQVELFAYAPKPILSLSGHVDFETLIADGQIQQKSIAILNHGVKSGKFKIKPSVKSLFKVMPLDGVVHAGYSQPLRFEFSSKKVGKFEDNMKVELDGSEDLHINLKANVVTQALRLLAADNKTNVHCIKFGATYYGTDLVQSYWLYNDSPQNTSFVALLEENVQGQEMGVDITRSVIDTCLEIPNARGAQQEMDASPVTCSPCEGYLAPYERRKITFKFSPRFQRTSKGWSKEKMLPPRQDFALFLSIGNIGNFSNDGGDSKIELALTGTALPVLLSILPLPTFHFDECLVGSSVETYMRLSNESSTLPICFAIQISAQFHASPICGYIEPKDVKEILISFRPKQFGDFKNKLILDVIGSQIEDSKQIIYKKTVIDTYQLNCSGSAVTSFSHKTHSNVLRTDCSKHQIDIDEKRPLVARECKLDTSNLPSRVAHASDLATSIRPNNRNEIVRTQFTKTERYSYVDPDYMYTDIERQKHLVHKERYNSYLGTAKRTQQPINRGLKGGSNIGDYSDREATNGLKPPKLTVREIKESCKALEVAVSHTKSSIMSSKDIDELKSISQSMKVTDGLKATPSTILEKKECSSLLTPQELIQILIGRKVIDFGEICKKSVCVQELTIFNNIRKSISFEVHMKFRELRQTSPVCQIIPPGTLTRLQFVLECNYLGNFERSVEYTINGRHKNILIIKAKVVPVHLELSSASLELSPYFGLPLQAGMKQCVSLINKRNLAADFFWTPQLVDGVTAFTIRPLKGTVEAFSSLQCEVTFHPSHSAKYWGMFSLHILNGNELQLNCSAKLSPASCCFVERHLMFGVVPLNLVTTCFAYLRNTGHNHAFFKLLNPEPIKGMHVTPQEGSVAVGGTTKIQFSYKPESIEKFDIDIAVNILGWKTISLRLGGVVNVPNTDVIPIHGDSFNFGGIYSGAVGRIPFHIINIAKTRVEMSFDLTMYKDFLLTDKSKRISTNNNQFFVSLKPEEVLDACLIFQPTEVTTYDFVLPCTSNNIEAPSPPASPYPASLPTISNSDVNSVSFPYPTPRRRVQAVGLRALLHVSTEELNFHALSEDISSCSRQSCEKCITFINNSKESLQWSLDKSSISEEVFSFLDENGTDVKDVTMEPNIEFLLRIVFKPGPNLEYSGDVPVILNKNAMQAYKTLKLFGVVESPSISFDQSVVVFTPVPLSTAVIMDVEITAQGYMSFTKLSVEVPSVELADGSFLEALHVVFPDGDTISKCCQPHLKCTLTCHVVFHSSKPVSLSTNIVFCDEQNSYLLPVIASADNCLLSCHRFLTHNQNSFHIVCDQTKSCCEDLSALLVCVPCNSPAQMSASGSLQTTSTFSLPISSYEGSSMLSLSSTSYENDLESPDDHPCSPNQSDRYLRNMMTVLQRWYSSQSWSSGVHPIKIAETFRDNLTVNNCINNVQLSENSSKEKKNIFDLVAHLCGKPIPGIAPKNKLSTNKPDKLKHIIGMYDALLKFLTCQGAIFSSIKPQHLLHPKDYESFLLLQQRNNENVPLSLFDISSKQSWTTVFLQIYKTLVLSHVTLQSLKKVHFPAEYPPVPSLNPDLTASNVYSIHERIVLVWLNHHYTQQRTKCWTNNLGVKAPASRWIVNFEHDFVDGLVLASLLSAYVPYLIRSHLSIMFTHPVSAQQCLHNCLIVVDVFRMLSLDYDVVATDITEPNSISILMLCVYLYRHLQDYIPKSTVNLPTSLHSPVTKHITVNNPSIKSLLYHAQLCGEFTDFFHLQSGPQIQVPPKGEVQISVSYKSHFLDSCEGTLILVGRRGGSATGATLAFTLIGSVHTINSSHSVSYTSPCYEPLKIRLLVENPFPTDGLFEMVLIESDVVNQVKVNSETSLSKKRSLKESMLNISQNKCDTKPFLSAFWSPVKQLHLQKKYKTEIEVYFLSFDIGKRQCSLLFINKTIGEFIYSIDVDCILPLPAHIPTTTVNGETNNHRVAYLHCDAESKATRVLQLDTLNTAKENAIVFAASRQMSEKERQRRQLTGITSSETILSAIASLQISDDHSSRFIGISGSAQEFTVTVSSPLFSAPGSIKIPYPISPSERETVDFPITISSCQPGQYPCFITLKAPNDIRVYHVEFTVKPCNPCVELSFETATHKAVTQDVPLTNPSDIDWHMDAILSGEGFYGPNTFVAEAGAISFYTLRFQPTYEGSVQGFLKLQNQCNGAEYDFILNGLGNKPKPLDTILIDCVVNEPTMTVLEVRNDFSYKMVFQTFSDLDILTGPTYVTVLPKQTVHVPINVLALKRGCTEGVVSFVYDAENVARLGLDNVLDSDSDNELPVNTYLSASTSQLTCLLESRKLHKPYRVWYELQMNVLPGPAVKKHQMVANVYEAVTMELLLANPLHRELCLDVVVSNEMLKGHSDVKLAPNSSQVYQLTFCPMVIGKNNVSVAFQSKDCAEFWYDFELVAKPAMPHVLPVLKCMIGSSTGVVVRLQNHSSESVVYDVTTTNETNFFLKDVGDQLVLPANDLVEVHIFFIPSAIGANGHEGQIGFQNEKNGTQTFIVSGEGLPPALNEDCIIYCSVGDCETTVVTFHNPFDVDVLVHVQLRHEGECENPEIKLLLPKSDGFVCPSRTMFEIPVSYTPTLMQASRCTCEVTVEAADAEGDLGDCETVTWRYLIQIYPISQPVHDALAPVLSCRAKERLEEKLEIALIVDQKTAKRPFSPIHFLGNYVLSSSQGLDSIEGYQYHFESKTSTAESDILRTVALTLKRKFVNQVTGVVSLIFELVFVPKRSFSHLVRLSITSPDGGIWRFPLMFESKEAHVDDIIKIESVGLNKRSSVAFRLNSQSSEPCEFEAFLVNSCDGMFTVSPTTGVLPSFQSDGQRFIVSYKPAYYGAVHTAKLVVQNAEIEWVYEIKGTTPDYSPPKVAATSISHRPFQDKSPRKTNFVLNNLQVSQTAVSSPVKGLIKKSI